jgi:hypothetical protein
MDRAGNRPVGLASKEASTPRLGNEVAQGKPAVRTDRTTRDGSRESSGSSRGHPPTAEVLKLHEELRKAEIALLTQACTKRIGLAEFLHRHKVLGFLTATCQCGAGHETPRHMALFCTYEADRRHYLHVGKNRTYTQMVGTKDRAKHFVQYIG